MKHSYEIGGIFFTVAILAGVLGGFALYNMDFGEKSSVMQESCGIGCMQFEKEMNKYYDDSKLQSYYDEVYKKQGDCKKLAYDYQDFFDCVNKPSGSGGYP